ncbi:MAG: tyrosine-type recombinase/integrase [Actinomycetota bacterium]|nr:tyrosine-type recombinase/integrase [Actinomycetota bacterium]
MLEPAEVAALLDHVPAATPLELRDRALFELAYATALRAEELVALDVTSIDFPSAHVRVGRGGGASRMVPAAQVALRAVGRYLERARGALAQGEGEDALFLSKSGRRLSSSDVRRRLRAWTRHAAIQAAVHPGARRPALVADRLDAGTQLRCAHSRLGQICLSTTQTSTRVESARLKRAYARSHPRA